MTTKTLTITEDAYHLLADRKLEKESFSEEIKRLLSKKKRANLSAFFGALSGETGNALEKAVEEGRKLHRRARARRAQ